MIRTSLFVLGLLIAGTTTASAMTLNAMETACAVEAASPFEPGFETTGRLMEQMDAERAIAVCSEALGSGENDYRLNAWLARAYYAAGQYGDASYFADRAAEEEVPLGLYIAGVLYSNGAGVERDPSIGSALLSAGVEADFVPAFHALAINLINGTGVQTDPELAREFLQLAADAGFAQSATTLGYMYFDGIGTAKDDAESARLLRLGAHLGDGAAMHQLGWYAEQGIGGPVDVATAEEFYWAAIETGNAQSMVNLAGLYIEGRGLQRDLETAGALLARAASLGNPDAIDVLDRLNTL